MFSPVCLASWSIVSSWVSCLLCSVSQPALLPSYYVSSSCLTSSFRPSAFASITTIPITLLGLIF